MLNVTVRECIKQLKKLGGYQIILNDRTKIDILPLKEALGLYEEGQGKDNACTLTGIKNINGDIIMRQIRCRVQSKSVNIDTRYSTDRDGEYILPERTVNELISEHGGVDIYLTFRTLTYTFSDAIYICSA